MINRLWIALLICVCASAQVTQTLFRTSLPNAVGTGDTQITISGSVSIIPDQMHPSRIYIDTEVMNVLSVQTTGTYNNVQSNTVLTVQRGYAGSSPIQHNAGALVYFGYAYQFIMTSLSGACQPGSAQYVNTSAQLWFTCMGGTWVSAPTAPVGGSGGGNVSTGGTLPIGNVIAGAGTQAIQDTGIPLATVVTAANPLILTNKNIDGTQNTLSNIPNSALVNSSTSVNGQTCALGGTCSVAISLPITSNLIKGNGGGGGNAALPGVDYQAAVSFSASTYGTNVSSPTGITAAITACGTVMPCNITIPANYGPESIQGFTVDYTTTDTSTLTPNIIINDLRGGNVKNVSSNCLYAAGNVCTYLQDAIVLTTNPVIFPTFHNSKASLLAGGVFNPSSVSNYVVEFNDSFTKTPGQLEARGAQLSGGSGNDLLIHSDSLNCYGYRGAPGFSEGCQNGDVTLYQGFFNRGSGDFKAPTTSTGTSLTTLALGNPTQLTGQLGAGRDIVNSTAGPSQTVTTSGFVCSGSAPCIVTVTGSTVAVSGAYGTVATAVTTLGPQAVTPTLTFGSLSNFSTSTLVCVADPSNESERIFPSAVGSTVTLNFTRTHAAGYYIYSGGLCGYDFEPVADEVTSATFPALGNAQMGGVDGTSIVGTAHRQYFILGSQSATTITVADDEAGAWKSFSFNSDMPPTGATVNLWKAALVNGVSTTIGLDAGNTGGTIPLGDNIMTVASGNIIAQPMGPHIRLGPGNNNVISLWGNDSISGEGFGFAWNFMTSSDNGFTINNNTPLNKYTEGGGQRSAPFYAFGSQAGPFHYPLYLAMTGGYADVAFAACYFNTCNNQSHKVIQEPNTSGSDAIYYDQVNQRWFLTNHNGGPAMYLDTTLLQQLPAIWISGGSYVTNAIAFSAGILYRNLTGTNTTTAPATDTTNWAALSGGSGGSGMVSTGTTGTLAYYAANGTTVSPLTLGTNLSITGSTLNAAGGGGLTSIPAFTALANDTSATAVPTGSNANALMGILGDDQTNAVGLNAYAPFRSRLYINKANGVTVGSGQSLGTRQATATGIQNAINACTTNNWICVLPPGIYEIDNAAGLTANNTTDTNALVIEGTKQSRIIQFHTGGAPVFTVGDPSGSTNYSWNIQIDGLRLEYGNSQSGNTASNTLVIGAVRNSVMRNIWIGADGSSYTAPNSPYVNQGYRGVYFPAASTQEFSNSFEDFEVQGGAYRLFDGQSIGTNSVFKNWYITNGYLGQPGQTSDSPIYINNAQGGAFINMNLEAVICNSCISIQNSQMKWQDTHLETIQLTGANPYVIQGASNYIEFQNFDLSGLYWTSATLNTVTGSGTAYLYATYATDVTTWDGLLVNTQNSGNTVTLPLGIFLPKQVGDLTPTIEARGISLKDSVSAGLVANTFLDTNLPSANFGGKYSNIGSYSYVNGSSRVSSPVLNVSSTYTVYGSLKDATIQVPASITSFTLTLADFLSAASPGSTIANPYASTIHVRRQSGTASGTLTIADASAGTITTNTTAASDYYYKFDGVIWRLNTDTGNSFGGGGSLPATPATSGISYAPVATPTGTSTTTYTATAIQSLPACSAMTSDVISGPCITPSGASGNFTYVDAQTGTTYTVPGSDAWGLATANNAAAVAWALPQANLGTNFPTGSSITIRNIGAGTLTLTPSTSTINGATTYTLATGHFVTLISSGGNYIIGAAY